MMNLIFIGTGASVPSHRRGFSSLAFRSSKTIICDFGEGTQLRFYQANISPTKIRYIFISHLHGDHVFGLPGFLTTQQMLGRDKPLSIFGPIGIQTYLSGIQRSLGYHIDFPLDITEFNPNHSHDLSLEQFNVQIKLLDHNETQCFGFRFSERPKPGKFDAVKAEKLGIPENNLRSELSKGRTVQLDNGTIVEPADVMGPKIPGKTIVYCTDTKPCDASVELAHKCDVLIHDSTFTSAFHERAVKTGHSTAKEAAEIAQKANSKLLFLWHISNRYDKNEEKTLLEEAKSIFSNTYLPNDFEKFNIS